MSRPRTICGTCEPLANPSGRVTWALCVWHREVGMFNHEPRPIYWGMCGRCHASGPLRVVVGVGGSVEWCKPCQPTTWDKTIGELCTVHEI